MSGSNIKESIIVREQKTSELGPVKEEPHTRRLDSSDELVVNVIKPTDVTLLFWISRGPAKAVSVSSAAVALQKV